MEYYLYKILVVLTTIMSVTAIIVLILKVLTIIGKWKAFKKAGQSGWKALIPIYNQIVLCEITDINPWWVAIVIFGDILLLFVPIVGPIVSFAVSIYYSIVLNISIAKSFGQSEGFGFGLCFLSPFFWIVLGFNKSKYIKPINIDSLGKSIGFYDKEEKPKENPQDKQVIDICPDCGKEINKKDKYCPNCGKKIK